MIINSMSSGKIKSEASGATVTITIDFAEKRNALTDAVLDDLVAALRAADHDPAVRAIVLAGSEKVFASGADVSALLARETQEAYEGPRTRNWAALRRISTPTVAAVSGFCLGGGCELAMICDLAIASETSRFGLPETQLGLIPGAGGTQMLPQLVGKALAMDMVLTGRLLDAGEALRAGLVSRVVPVGEVVPEAETIAAKIASRPAVAQRLAKQVITESFNTDLEAGIANERKAFAIAFATNDAREGMTAFVEGRDPVWTHG